MSDRPLNCVVFGAGALGLGFLGPELCSGCRITYVDIPAKAPLLEHLSRTGRYTCNQTGLSMRAVEVGGVSGLCLGAEEGPVQALLAEADIVFTAVGQRNLPKLAPTFAAALVGRAPDRPLRVLCSENGVEIARGLRDAIAEAAKEGPGDALRVGDTVMGRMCKIVESPEPPVEPAAPGLDWAVVSEPFYGIPVEGHALRRLPAVPAAVRPLPPAEFSAAEDMKMVSHNGLHAVLACLGYLRGVLYFDELRDEADLMEIGRRLLVEEAAEALLRKHGPALPRNECLNYCDSILRRVTCPVLHDPIARGMRGIMRKLLPWERLVYSVRTIVAQGILPQAYATGLAAAVVVARRTGETEMGFEEVLTEHCGLDPDADAELLELVRRRRRRFED